MTASDTMDEDRTDAFRGCDRPDAMLITNHGYAGVVVPVGGAADTGGQVFYVNSLALALDHLGYRVTIVARGGFPHFGTDRRRQGEEFLSDHVRYLFAPGGSDTFIRKEEIAVALDEQVDWLDRFIRHEAVARGVKPWETYEFLNSHYWDAAVLGMQLVERWRDDRAADLLDEHLADDLALDVRLRERVARHRSALGNALPYHVGRMMRPASTDPQVQVRLGEETLRRRCPGWRTSLDEVDRHVWTPHSLSALKEENFRDKPQELVRDLRFCERRDHERAVCGRVRAYAATSPEIAERLHTHYGTPFDRIFAFPPCVDRDVFRPYGEDELDGVYAWIARQTGVSDHRLRAASIVFEASRNDETKRKDLLLHAFARAAAEAPDALLLVAGGPHNDVFESLMTLRSSSDVLRQQAHFLLGRIPDDVLFPLFSMADVYCTPSEMEGFGMSAAQAAAAGTALICSDLVPFATQFAAEAAVVVPAGDEEALTAALTDLLTDEWQRRRRGKRLFELTRSLDWVEVTAAFLSHLRSSGIPVAPGHASPAVP